MSVHVLDTQMASGYEPPSGSMAPATTAPLTGDWQVDIRPAGRWRYDLTLRRDWLAMTPVRIWGRRRAVRRAHEMVGDQRPSEPIATVGGSA